MNRASESPKRCEEAICRFMNQRQFGGPGLYHLRKLGEDASCGSSGTGFDVACFPAGPEEQLRHRERTET